eukprot:gb/GECG01001738.1/.p1 GENE.gb/GECG01001738.1/~~gb/GECG01001738.1/.p1  ORF type:complete len:1129 (+),score=127.59 gb/GECG01001738.1/:1-3387(+)
MDHKRRLSGDENGGTTSSQGGPQKVFRSASHNSTTSTNGSGSISSFTDDLKRDYAGYEEENGEDNGDVLGTASSVMSNRWHRPPPSKEVDAKNDNFVFQWMDADMYDGFPLSKNPDGSNQILGSTSGPVPVIRLYGVTNEGISACCHIHGFTPYFFSSVPSNFDPNDIEQFRRALDSQVKQIKGSRANYGGNSSQNDIVLSVQLVTGKQSIYGYRGDQTSSFLKIFISMPSFVPTARGALEKGFSFGEYPLTTYQCYEANMPFVLRFMIDKEISGCNWVEFPKGTYKLRSATAKNDAQQPRKKTSCQVELDIMYNNLVSHSPEGKWQQISPFRILSFDIECCGRKGHFPEAEHDPVIQIANVVTCQGSEQSTIRNVFVLGGCSPIVGAQVISFDNEKDLLEAWARFVRESDPDVITGYNIQNFDIPYVLNRAKSIGAKDTSLLGRVIGSRATMRDTTFQSSAYGKTENVETNIEGRVMFDMLQYVRRSHKLSSYTLNSVSAEFLGQQKEDVHHSIISDLYKGSNADRHRLAVYCLKDAYLPQKLMDKLMVMINHVEMARVTGVPLSFLLSRGQQIKVLSMLYRKCGPKGLLIPTMKNQQSPDEGSYEGATVIEPIKGFYNEPITTLDFASLYPSIMMAHNLCYSTLVSKEDLDKIPSDHYQTSPSNDHFVKKSVKKGVLPEILEELLSARKRAKKDMAAAEDPMVKAVQNGRQLALKVSANSVYGFTGATVGQLPCLAISSTVTSYGREMIETTKKAVEERYTVANGYPSDAVVVYGDTDSVMVKFGVSDVKTAMDLGEEAAVDVSNVFPDPVRLEFEKVYYPYLLMNKKRYAGMFWTNSEKPDKMDAKGIETVRRDNCGLVRQVVDTVLRKILMEHSVEGAVRYTKQVISDLLQNKLDISLLVITKALGKSGDSSGYAAKQAHVELAERMRKRDPGSAPVVGDRVPYVIVKAEKGAPAYMKSEDPIYVLDHNIPIDTQYYLDNQLSKPLLRIFEPVVDNAESLLKGDHTRSIKKATPSSSRGIMQFAVTRLTCLAPGCNVPLKEGEHSLCKRCKENEPEIYRWKLSEVNDMENKYARLWTQCQRCQGSLHQDVLCTARDCPIFYMRKKAQKDLEEVTNQLHRFDLDW